MKDYFILAFKSLKKRGVRSWLTLLGILIGVAAVVSLISLGNGLKAAVNSQFNVGSTEVLTVQAGGLNNYGPPGSGAATPLTISDAEAISKLGDVQTAIPINIRQVEIGFNQRVGFTYMLSIPDNQAQTNDIYKYDQFVAASGKLINQGDRGVVVLGSNAGDSSKNGFGRDIHVGDAVTINGKDFVVQGILKKTGSVLYDNLIMMNAADMKSLLGYGNVVDQISVKVINEGAINQTVQEINNLMDQRRNVNADNRNFQVSTPEAMLKTINQIISGIQIFIIVIASISILVGAIGITNTMTTSVLERKKEIGIMKAIGARNEQIFYLFFIEAGLLGLIGGIIGVLLGIGIGYIGTSALNALIGATTQPQISIWLIVFTMLGSFIIGAFSGFVPALRAAKASPVEEIRG